MKYIDLNQQYHKAKEAIDSGMQRVLEHGQFIMGPEIKEMEQKLAEMVGVKHCISCSSGTTALQLALMAVGVGPGDEVITTPFSFFATAEVIYLLGARPVYVDINPDTYNIDPNLIEAAITDNTKAIIPVSLYGQCADMDEINTIAAKRNIAVIEDGAQSLGGSYKGKPSCGLSTIGCSSFFPSKPLGCYGDGGACFTNDDELAQRLRMFSNHGQNGRYNHEAIGINGRMDTLQAAVILAKLPLFKQEIADRQQVAAWYAKAFDGRVKSQLVEEHNLNAWAQYTIEVAVGDKGRDAVREALAAKGIPTAVHYPVGLHQQPIIKKMHGELPSFPFSEAASRQVMSVPFHPYMTEGEVKEVAEAVLEVITVSV